MGESTNELGARQPDRLVALLHATDAALPRPVGAPITLARLEARARRHTLRKVATATAAGLAALTLWFALWFPRAAPHAAPAERTAATGKALWADLRARSATLRRRELDNTWKLQLAIERAALTSLVYAERLLASGDARGTRLLQELAERQPTTRGGRDAAALLASNTHRPR